MRHVIVLLLVALAPVAVMAQVDPNPNTCGVYFDEEATQNCLFTTTPMQEVTAYLCVTNLTDHSGISAWECDLEITGGGLIAPSWTILWNGTVFFLEWPPFAVGIGTVSPALWSPSIVLSRMHAYAVDPAVGAEFRITASPSPSIPGQNGMVVAAGDNEFVIYPIYNSTGYGSDGVPNICAAINNAGPCPVPTENTTWGGVKAMFE